MITSVTISTVSTVTTVAMMGFGMALGVVAVGALIAFLCIKELATVSGGSSQRSVGKFIGIGIVPLTIVFATIVAVKVVEILG